MDTNPPTVQFQLRISPELRQRLRVAAARAGLDMSAICAEALAKHLDELEGVKREADPVKPARDEQKAKLLEVLNSGGR